MTIEFKSNGVEDHEYEDTELGSVNGNVKSGDKILNGVTKQGDASIGTNAERRSITDRLI